MEAMPAPVVDSGLLLYVDADGTILILFDDGTTAVPIKCDCPANKCRGHTVYNILK